MFYSTKGSKRSLNSVIHHNIYTRNDVKKETTLNSQTCSAFSHVSRLCSRQVNTGARCTATRRGWGSPCWRPNEETRRRPRPSAPWPLCPWPTPTPWIKGEDPETPSICLEAPPSAATPFCVLEVWLQSSLWQTSIREAIYCV